MSDPSEGFVTKLSPSSAPWLFGELLQKITKLLAMKSRGIDKPQASSFNTHGSTSPFFFPLEHGFVLHFCFSGSSLTLMYLSHLATFCFQRQKTQRNF